MLNGFLMGVTISLFGRLIYDHYQLKKKYDTLLGKRKDEKRFKVVNL